MAAGPTSGAPPRSSCRRIERRRSRSGSPSAPGRCWSRTVASGPGLTVALPELDQELEAAGFGKPPTGIGERAWLLRQLVAHIPPARWVEWLAPDPPTLIDRALRTEEKVPSSRAGSTRRHASADATWATALLERPEGRSDHWRPTPSASSTG